MDDTIVIHRRKLLAQAWGKLETITVGHETLDGRGQVVDREVYDHGNAAAVLLHDPVAGLVVLIRQFRLPPHLNGDPARLIETCAGLLDGDDPETCARREAIEESGYAPGHLHHLFDAYMSPGSLTEKVHCFVGSYRSGEREGDGGGLAHEGEDIEVLEMPLSGALAMISSGEIVDAKTIMLLQWLALNPDWAR